MTPLTREQIKALLPHREPFLFVESAHIIDPGQIQGTCRWPSGNPVFAGHFPHAPIVPGVLIVEAMAQLAGILLAHRTDLRGLGMDEPIGVLTGIRQASFHQPVPPECDLRFSVKLDNPVGRMVGAHAIGHDCAGQRVCQCKLSIALIERADLMTGIAATTARAAPCAA